MSSRNRIAANIPDLDQMLKRLGAAIPEVAHVINPITHDILMHPFTNQLIEEIPEYKTLLANLKAKETVRNLGKMDVDQKLINMGLSAAGIEAEEKDDADGS